MASYEVGKIWMPSGAPELRDEILRDIENQAKDLGIATPPTQPGTDWHILATALANVGIVQFTNIRIAERQSDVLTATGDKLDQIREAEGLPVVEASPSSGKIYVGVTGGSATTLVDGTQFLLPNGKRGKVAGTHSVVVNGSAVNVITIDTGADTELDAGEIVKFTNPPLNVQVEAEVSIESPLRGGRDAETDERKRARILNRRRNVPQGGNAGHLIELALNALASAQYAFVYPALGGPSSVKVVVIRDIDPDRNSFTRALPTAALAIVRGAIHDAMPDGNEVVVGTCVDVSVDCSLEVTIPDAASQGGNGTGWVDATPWPPLDGGDTKVTVTALGATYDIKVDAATTTSPIAGQTHVSWWSPTERRFYTRLVTGVGGGTGVWELTLDAPFVDGQNVAVAIGDYISPAAVNIDAYGETWRTQMRSLGPGENTSDANRLPRALRHPFIADEWPSDLSITQLLNMKLAHPEITDIDWSYRSSTAPAVPGTVDLDPRILMPRHFGIYVK